MVWRLWMTNLCLSWVAQLQLEVVQAVVVDVDVIAKVVVAVDVDVIAVLVMAVDADVATVALLAQLLRSKANLIISNTLQS